MAHVPPLIPEGAIKNIADGEVNEQKIYSDKCNGSFCTSLGALPAWFSGTICFLGSRENGVEMDW